MAKILDFFKNKRNVIIVVLSLILLISIIITLILLLRDPGDGPNPILPPDYPPQQTDPNQESIGSETNPKLDHSEGGGAVNITYRPDVLIDLSEGVAALYYANPSQSTQNVAVALVIDDVTIAKSELITPGHKISQLPLEKGVAEKLAVGGYDAKYVVYFYHPETGEKAIVDSVAEGIKVTVQE